MSTQPYVPKKYRGKQFHYKPSNKIRTIPLFKIYTVFLNLLPDYYFISGSGSNDLGFIINQFKIIKNEVYYNISTIEGTRFNFEGLIWSTLYHQNKERSLTPEANIKYMIEKSIIRPLNIVEAAKLLLTKNIEPFRKEIIALRKIKNVGDLL